MDQNEKNIELEQNYIKTNKNDVYSSKIEWINKMDSCKTEMNRIIDWSLFAIDANIKNRMM